jgi:hypothetical protein
MNDSYDKEFNEAWEKMGGDWLAHQWWELQRSKMLLGKLRTLKDIEVFYPRLHDKIAYSGMLKREAIRHIKRQRIQNYRKITEYFRCESCVKEGKQLGALEAGYATSKMKIVIQCHHCKNVVRSIDIAEIKNEWIRDFFNITKELIA